MSTNQDVRCVVSVAIVSVTSMIQELTTNQFIEEIHDYRESPDIVNKKGKPIILDFYADWCAPCKTLSPVLEKIAQEFSGIEVRKVNVEDEAELTQTFEIAALPSIFLIPVEGDPKFLVGVPPEEVLRTAIKDVFQVK